MSPGYFLLLIAVAGVAGGILNALISTGGFDLPRLVQLTDGRRQFVPGFLGNVLVGAGAAVVLALLYGPLADVIVGPGAANTSIPLTLRTLGGAALSGIGGARLLTQEVDRRYNDAANANAGKTISSLLDTIAREQEK